MPYQDVHQDAAQHGSGPTIEPIETFAQRWTGSLILISNRAFLAGSLAMFDFTWFISSLVKYRKHLFTPAKGRNFTETSGLLCLEIGVRV